MDTKREGKGIGSIRMKVSRTAGGQQGGSSARAGVPMLSRKLPREIPCRTGERRGAGTVVRPRHWAELVGGLPVEITTPRFPGIPSLPRPPHGRGPQAADPSPTGAACTG